MTTEQIYNEHYLRRWTMDGYGDVQCHHNAIDVRINTSEVVDLVKAHNELLLNALEEKREYEVALGIVEPVDEPLQLSATDDEGQITVFDNPVWVRWNAAVATIDSVSDEVRAWHLTLIDDPFTIQFDVDQASLIQEPVGEPETVMDELGVDEIPNPKWVEYNAAQAIIDAAPARLAAYEAAKALRDETYIDTAPNFTPVTDSPLYKPLKRWAFEAVIELTPGLKDRIDSAIDSLPAEMAVQKVAIKKRFETTDEYDAFDPLFTAMRPLVNMTDEEFVQLWTMGLQIQESF